MKNWPPTAPDEIAALAHMTTREVAAAYGVKVGAIESFRRRHGVHMSPLAIARARQEGKPDLPVEWDEIPAEADTPEAFEALYNAFANVKDTLDMLDPRRDKLGLTLKGSAPVGLVFSSDWQIGSEGVDMERWRADMDLMLAQHQADPGSFRGIGLGDYQSAAVTLNLRGSGHRDIIQSHSQISLCRGLFRRMQGFWLLLLDGCHDTFTTKAGDINPVRDFYCSASGARYGWHGVELRLRLAAREYVLRLRHKGKYNSAINPLNAQRRQAEFEGAADIIAHAHLHTSLLGDLPAVGRDTIMLRSGSYQIFDEFSRQQVGNVQADPRSPMVILYPDGTSIWSCRDFRDGLHFLRAERERYKNQVS